MESWLSSGGALAALAARGGSAQVGRLGRPPGEKLRLSCSVAEPEEFWIGRRGAGRLSKRPNTGGGAAEEGQKVSRKDAASLSIREGLDKGRPCRGRFGFFGC